MISVGLRTYGDLLNSASINLVSQDYIIRMIAKKGRVVSCKKEPIFCEVIDLCFNAEQQGRIYKMNLADSSYLEQQRPEFASKKVSEGLLGTWKLCANGYIKFVEFYDGPCTKEAIITYLLDPASHESVRSWYEKYGTL